MTRNSRFLRYLVSSSYVEVDFSDMVPKYNIDLRFPLTYSLDEIHRMEQFVEKRSPEKRDYVVILLASRLEIHTGDINLLKMENIDFVIDWIA